MVLDDAFLQRGESAQSTMALAQRITARARQAQRNGKAGEAIKLWILAGEAKTIRYGAERVHKA